MSSHDISLGISWYICQHECEESHAKCNIVSRYCRKVRGSRDPMPTLRRHRRMPLPARACTVDRPPWKSTESRLSSRSTRSRNRSTANPDFDSKTEIRWDLWLPMRAILAVFFANSSRLLQKVSLLTDSFLVLISLSGSGAPAGGED